MSSDSVVARIFHRVISFFIHTRDGSSSVHFGWMNHSLVATIHELHTFLFYGYTSAASLNADKDNQGAAVGLAMVAPGIGFALGPLLSGFLYSNSMNLPFIFILPLFLLLIILIKKLEGLN